jgi:hypothetical protein
LPSVPADAEADANDKDLADADDRDDAAAADEDDATESSMVVCTAVKMA